MQLLLRGDAICPDDGVQISRVLVIQSWGCAGTLGLGAGNSNNVVGSSGKNNGSNAPSSGGGGVGGMIHAASSSVSSTLGGITGIVLGGGHSGTAIIADGSSINSHSHYLSNRSVKEDTSIALKILQTITMLVDSRSVILSQDVLGACLSICLLLGAGQTYSDGNSGSSGAASSAVGSIRDRFRAETVNAQQHHHVAAKDHDTTGGGTAGNVKRAALATMNQILSILFERAKDVMMLSIQQEVASSDDEETTDSSILVLAERTMTDLCTLVNKSSSTGGASTPSKSTSSSSTSKLYGPFATASKEGLSPSSTTSLALVDMIMKQICNDLFHVCFDFFLNGGSEQQQQVTATTTNPGIEFAIRIIIQSFQLGQSLLGSQYCYHVTKLSLEFSLKSSFKDISSIPSLTSSGPSNLIDFCLYYYTTSLVTTLLTHYLSSTDVTCYEKLDAYVVENCVENNSSEISKMALDMMKQLVSFVSEATEAYHKSDDFEVSVSERLDVVCQLYIFYLHSQLLIFYIVGWLHFHTNREGSI